MKSKVYRNLTPKTLDEVSIDDIDNLRSTMFAQGRGNKRGYDELQQVAIASNVQGGSGSVPGTSIIVAVSNIYDNKSTLYAPSIGTWILEAVAWSTTGGSGTYTNEIYIEHTNGAQMLLDSTTNLAARPQIEIDTNVTILANMVGGGGAPGSSIAYAYLMRRR